MYKQMLIAGLVATATLSGCSMGDPEPVVSKARFSQAVEGRPMTGGYFTVDNPSQSTLTLVSVEAAAPVSVMMHETVKTDEGWFKMNHLPSVDIAPGESVVFKSGGKHLMISGVTPDQTELELEFCFSTGQCQTVVAQVYSL